jgi:hypothetical protein
MLMPHIYDFLFPWPKQESISLFKNQYEGKDFGSTKRINNKCTICLKMLKKQGIYNSQLNLLTKGRYQLKRRGYR